MVKKIGISSLIFILCVNSYPQDRDNCMEMVDSMLILMKQLILTDLSKDSIEIQKRPMKGLGEFYVFEVVFDSKTTYILNIGGFNESKQKKYNKQESSFIFRKRYHILGFKQYIHEHNELPYNSFEYFSYKFLLFAKTDETYGGALYGEYKFKVTEKNIMISDKKIQILQSENEILQVYDSML